MANNRTPITLRGRVVLRITEDEAVERGVPREIVLEPGNQIVDAWVADHPYVRAHRTDAARAHPSGRELHPAEQEVAEARRQRAAARAEHVAELDAEEARLQAEENAHVTQALQEAKDDENARVAAEREGAAKPARVSKETEEEKNARVRAERERAEREKVEREKAERERAEREKAEREQTRKPGRG
jgi:ABC-type proline/glycine betaine transport system ATPase subunit